MIKGETGKILEHYKQFPTLIQQTLKHIQEAVPYPKKGNKKNLARKLYNRNPQIYASEKMAERAITNAWNLVKGRALPINNQPMELMELSKSKYYSGTLRKILMRLRPDLTKVEIEEWERELLRSVDEETAPI